MKISVQKMASIKYLAYSLRPVFIQGIPEFEHFARLRLLQDRIGLMAAKQLRDCFISLEDLKGVLVLNLRAPLTEEERNRLQILLGWVQIFDEEFHWSVDWRQFHMLEMRQQIDALLKDATSNIDQPPKPEDPK